MTWPALGWVQFQIVRDIYGEISNKPFNAHVGILGAGVEEAELLREIKKDYLEWWEKQVSSVMEAKGRWEELTAPNIAA